MRTTVVVITVLLATALAGCPAPSDAPEQGAETSADSPAAGVLATVNGVAITDKDVELALRRRAHNSETNPEAAKQTLETLIERELMLQKSLEAGMADNEQYRSQLARYQAQMNDFKRERGAQYFRQEVLRSKAKATEADAQAYFEENKQVIATSLHVYQLFYKGDRTAADQALEALKTSKTFEDVSMERFPNLPPGVNKPWDLGFLSWHQMPETWKSTVYKLSPGDITGVMSDGSGRYWIVKLVDKRVDEDVSFDSVKGKIMQLLESERIKSTMESEMTTLRKAADIEYK